MKKPLLLALISWILAIPFSLFAYQPENKPDNEWSRIKTPTLGLPQPIGGYANGCMEGGKTLPQSGEGYLDMRRHRNRYYGQPELITFIEALGKHTYQRYNKKHLIGDLSQPRGGRMNFGHTSHQVGLDVDIWMQTLPSKQSVDPYQPMQTIVNKASGQLIKTHLDPVIRDALYFAATYPQTARIFVNPVVKQYLCQTELETTWLRKLRPWWGHDEHFHVRLTCPATATDCHNQKPVPEGDGCHENLSNWVKEQSGLVTGSIKPKPRQKTIKKKVKQRPSHCYSLQLD